MAKSDIGTITIMLEAKGQQFDASMKKATKDVGKFQASVKAATGKMAVAWTSLQSKISLVTGGLEAGFKAASSVVRLFKGDMDGAYEVLASMPMGIGPVVQAMAGFYMDVSGYTEILEQQTKTAARLKEEMKQLEAQVKRNQEAMSKASGFVRGDEFSRLARQRHGDDLEFDRAAELEAITREYNEATGALAMQMLPTKRPSGGFGLPEISQEAGAKRMSQAQQVWSDRTKAANEYFDTIKKTEKLERFIGIAQEAHAQNISDLNKNAAHDLKLLSIQGADDADISARRLKHHKDIGDSIKRQKEVLETFGADESLIAGVAQQITDHATQGVRDLELSLEELLKKQQELNAQAPKAVSSTFSTAVGQIVLPDARQSGENRRAQLEELKKINGSIAQLNSSLASSRGIYP